VLVRLKKHIDHNFPFLTGKKILVAISGGIDSVVLAHSLHQLEFDISLAHCNFRLRGKASDEDQLFVEELASEMNIPFFTVAFDTAEYVRNNGDSNNLDYITTAHHLDDNLETFLINFTRGTGLNGLTGIPAINGIIVRLLLPFTRVEIEQYAKEHNIVWREDQSNSEITYKRNKIRHKVIPLLKELNPQLLTSFKKTTEYLDGSQQIVNDAVESVKKGMFISAEAGTLKINIEKLKNLTNTKAYIFELLKDYGFTEWDDVADLIDAQSGKLIYSQTHRLIKDRNHFLLEPIQSQHEKSNFKILDGERTLNVDNFELRLTASNSSKEIEIKSAVQVDAEKLQFPLELRKWKAGDYFYPLGMKGKKKLSKFFKDEKLSLIDKENVWLLCSNNEIIWVVNRRLDDRFKITQHTKKTILIEYIER